MLHKGYRLFENPKLGFHITDLGGIKYDVAGWGAGMERMAKRPVVGAFCCAMLLSSSIWSPGWAASVEPGQGSLTINQGQGFQPVNSRVDAKVGDAVMVGPNGSASVVYDDGCTVNVQPGAVTTITPLSPCASGSYAQTNDDSSQWGAVALGAGALGLVGTGIWAVSTTNHVNGVAASP